MTGPSRATPRMKRTSSPGPAWLTGGCHCGAVRFRVRARQRAVLDCNCRVCIKKGNLHLLVGERDFELLSGRDALAVYTFGARVAQHYFCSGCGIHPFYRPHSLPDPTLWDVNARCLDDGALARFRIEALDGHGIEATATAALKSAFPKASLERKYIALCEEGIYSPSRQTARLRVTPIALDGIVRRIQDAIAGIGKRLASEEDAVQDKTSTPSRRKR
jgi:hypothetical protein